MSAFLCNNTHITALAAFAERHDVQHTAGMTMIQIGMLLHAENVKSVNHRYPNHQVETNFEVCDWAVNHRFDPVQIVKAAHCLDYQSCEHDGWEASHACKIVNAIIGVASTKFAGYDDAMWEITTPSPVAAKPPAPTPKADDTPIGRDDAITRIKAALKKRSGKAWSVTGGRGTAWGWIEINCPPKRRTWHYLQTNTPEPPTSDAVYAGVNCVTPSRYLNTMSESDRITSPMEDPWVNEAIRKGQKLTYNWEVNDPTREFGHMGLAERIELSKLLGLENSAHHQGHNIGASGDYRREYVDRAEGREPSVIGKQYWD